MQIERKLLIVEDEQCEIDNVSRLLLGLDIKFKAVKTLGEAFNLLSAEAFDYLLTDLHIESKAGFDRPDGLKVIESAKEQQPNILIVANSSDPRADVWELALKAGAQHFIRKPLIKVDELVIAFSLAKERKILTSKQAKRTPGGLWSQYSSVYPDGIVIDKATANTARGLARHKNTSTTIMGETGTGKEEIAKLIFQYRSEAEGEVPFVAVNCATITGNLAESILFGHHKGAFTGADKTTNGYIADADGGILFLDEIHSLDITVQQKLLRVLNDGTYHRLGENKVYRSQFQLIAASTKDLDDEVDGGKFLIDLRNRILGMDIYLKPLRERKEAIEPLVALYFARREIPLSPALFKDLATHLKTYYWRGNIRQLFKALESWILASEFDEVPLAVENFPIFKGMLAPEGKNSASKLAQLSGDEADTIILKSLHENMNHKLCVDLFEKTFLANALHRNGSIAACCKALDMSRSTLDSRRKTFDLD